MSLFFEFHPDRYPPGSFQTPVQPPEASPEAEPLVSLCINQEWIPFILGALTQLTMNTTWQGTDLEIEAARQQANNLILIFQLAQRGCPSRLEGTSGASEDYMIRQDPANPCLLQSSVDGINWCTFADISKCFPNSQPAQGTQPTPAGGGCSQYTGEASIGHSWSLPNQVSSGDTITVTNANGLWASPLDLFISRCPDGNLWFELACVDGTGHTEPGDPAPTINHDSLIGFDGTNYYDFGLASDGTPVTITIGGGVSNAPFVMMCNTPDSSGTGNVVFDIQYCNNATATWTHTFDFRATPNPFVILTDAGQVEGHWVAGTGIVFSDVTGLPQTIRVVEGHIPMAARTLTNITLQFNFANGLNDANASVPLQSLDTNIGVVFQHISGSGPTGTPVVISTPISQVGVTNIHLELISDDTNSSPTGNAVLIGMVVSGQGTDPF